MVLTDKIFNQYFPQSQGLNTYFVLKCQKFVLLALVGLFESKISPIDHLYKRFYLEAN